MAEVTGERIQIFSGAKPGSPPFPSDPSFLGHQGAAGVLVTHPACALTEGYRHAKLKLIALDRNGINTMLPVVLVNGLEMLRKKHV